MADTLDTLGITGQIHLRGLHYAFIGQMKPAINESSPKGYTNTPEDWLWLGAAVKAARWLGYIRFDQIDDHRNDDPEIRIWTPPNPDPWVSVDFDVTIPEYDDLAPYVGVDGFTAAQPYHLALVGEKSSLRDVLGAVADRHHADLYLPAGDPSDAMFYTMAKTAARDGRPLVVLYFSDCDPSGWNMPIVNARKLQAFKATLFPQLDFRIHRACLTPDQAREYDLPDSPLKEGEGRGQKWREAFGVEQTEIDALATLQPDLLRELAEDAIAPFYDSTLDARVDLARVEWRQQAQEMLDEQTGDRLEQLRIDAAEALERKRAEIQEILETIRMDADGFDLPTPVVPEAELDPDQPPPLGLCSSRWSFAMQTRALLASKDYKDVDEAGWSA